MENSNCTTLLLVRHGQSEANLTKCFAGHLDMPLTDLGRQQAQRTAKFLIDNYTIDAVYTSDLSRAAETGSAIAEKAAVPICHEPNLREIYAGIWEGVAFSDLEQKFPEDYGLWRTDIGNSHPTGGESVAQLVARIDAALRKIAEENPGKTVVVVSHGTPIRATQWSTTGQPISHMKDVPWASNASVTELFYQDGRFHLGKVSQDAHLAELRSHLPANV